MKTWIKKRKIWLIVNLFSFNISTMKALVKKRKIWVLASLFSFLLLNLVSLSFFIKTKRNLSSFSKTEIEYAEKYLLEDSPTSSKQWEVAPHYKEEAHIKKDIETFEQKINRELTEDYKENLIKTTYKVTGKKPSRPSLKDYLSQQAREIFERADQRAKQKYVQEFLANALRGGYKITLDQDYNILSVKAISQ